MNQQIWMLIIFPISHDFCNVFSNAMKYHGANICANSPTNIDTDNIYHDFCTEFDYFAPK